MKNKRDLWILGGTSLLIAVVLFVAIGVGTRRQQQAQVEELWSDLSLGHNEKVRHLVSTTDVLDHASDPRAFLLRAVLFCDPSTVQTFIDRGIKLNSRITNAEKETRTIGTLALNSAVIFRRADIVEVLLRNGADAKLKTHGQTAIDYLKAPPATYQGDKWVGTDAQIAHLLREAQHKAAIHK